jgi:hypothetical protein
VTAEKFLLNYRQLLFVGQFGKRRFSEGSLLSSDRSSGGFDGRERALQRLESLANLPNGVTYGDLHLNPVSDSLRGGPRFEHIVASLAPKP